MFTDTEIAASFVADVQHRRMDVDNGDGRDWPERYVDARFDDNGFEPRDVDNMPVAA